MIGHEVWLSKLWAIRLEGGAGPNHGRVMFVSSVTGRFLSKLMADLGL